MSDEEEYEYTYSDDDDEIGYTYCEETVVKQSKFHVPDCDYRTLKYREILPMMHELVVELSDLFQIDEDDARILLRYCRWNKEVVIDKYYADNSKLMVNAGVRLEAVPIPADGETNCIDAEIMCRICCDIINTTEMVGLRCDHKFCRTCYGRYVDTQVADGPSCVTTRCPEHKCQLVVPWNLIQAVASPDSFEKYLMYFARNFIETNGCLRWCPSAGCDGVVVGRGVKTVVCSCLYAFCFMCYQEAHDPCSCEQAESWQAKCVSESMNATWIMANTKKCPKCDARIEKNQGCMHMTCRICWHGFCWTCLQPWAAEGHTWNHADCNKYVATDEVEQVDQKAKSSTALLERYIHYFERYHGHDAALKFAAEQRTRAEARMAVLGELGRAISSPPSAWTDVEFIKQAVDQVIACRRVLKYSYVFGFYLRDNTAEKQLFEHHQQILEKHTEELSGLTERYDAEGGVSADSTLTAAANGGSHSTSVASAMGDLTDAEAADGEESREGSLMAQCVNLTRTTEKFMRSLLCELADERLSREDLRANLTEEEAKGDAKVGTGQDYVRARGRVARVRKNNMNGNVPGTLPAGR